MRFAIPFRTSAVLVALALVGALATAPPRAAARPADGGLAVEFEDGAQAPAHGWTQDDGCPARTGASAARPLRGPLERAWKASLSEGTLEGDPLAWKDRVYLVERTPKRRVLRVLSAASGGDRGRLGFETTVPLSPCVGEGRVVLQTSPTVVEGLSVGGSSLARRWKVVAQRGLGAPTMIRDEVYLVRDGVLERWAYGANAPTWPKSPDAADAVRVEAGGAEGSPPRFPRPSLRGSSVFVTSGHDLVEVERSSGATLGRASFEDDLGGDAARIVVAAGDVFVRRAAPGASPEADALRAARPSAGTLEPLSSLPLRAGLATAGPAWIGAVDGGGEGGGERGRRLCGGRTQGIESEPFVLAGPGLHDEFVLPVAPTWVPGAVYVGLRAFAFPSLSVLRVSGPTTVSRAIPLRDRLIVAETPALVSAWRAVRRADEPVALGAPPAGKAAPIAFKACRAALEDGRVLDGPFSFDPKANVFRSTKPGELAGCPARDVDTVLGNDAPRKVLFAPRPAGAAIGVTAIVRAETAKAVLALVPTALAAGDTDLARRALATALELGAPDADVGKAEATVAPVEASPPARDDEKAAAALAELERLALRETDVLLDVAEAMPKDAPIEVVAALVRAALQRDPESERAATWIRARLPSCLVVPTPFLAQEWLDFVEVRGRLQVRVWGVHKESHEPWASEGEPPSIESDVFRKFWSAYGMWPADTPIVAFECGPLEVFAPLERPGAIVKCLALGRLVADTLDATFAPMGPPRTDAEKLPLLMFSTREQYLEFSRPGGEADRADGLENTAGHYSPSDNVTRIFFPDDDDEDSVPGVYAHELTHHWIERRRPGAQENARGERSSSTPGYFVVEGFADFVRGFVFDVAARRATPENPHCDYADVLTGVAPEALIAWPSLLTMSQKEFHDLSAEQLIPVPRRWRLGPAGATVPIALFYDQASAVVAYLYLAENGKHRKALFDFLYAYYAGKAQADMLSKSTGLSSEELGKRALAWCRDLAKKG